MADDFIPRQDEDTLRANQERRTPAPVTPPSIFDPSAAQAEAALLRWIDQNAPVTRRVRRYEDRGPDIAEGVEAAGAALDPSMPGARVVAGAISGVASLLTSRRTIEGSGAGPITDITAANVVHEGVDESRAEKTLGWIRRMGRIAGGIPGEGTWTQAGIQRLIAEGQIAPPQTRADEIVDFITPLLANIGIFGGASLAAGAGAGLAASAMNLSRTLGGIATAAEIDAGVTGASLLGGQIGAGLGRTLAANVPGIAGVTAATGGKVTAEVIGEALAGLGIDLGMGVGFAGAEIGLTRAMGTPVTREEALKMTGQFAAFSLGLGAAMRVPTGYRAIKAWRSLRHGESTAIPVGTVVEGRTAVGSTTTGGTLWHDANGDFAARPSPDGVRAAADPSIRRMEEVLNGTPEGQMAMARLDALDPNNPSTLPADITATDLAEAQLMGTQYFLNTLAKGTRGPEESWARPRQSLVNQRAVLRQVAADPNAPKPARVSALAVIKAINERLGESTGTLAGLLPWDLDLAAMTWSKNLGSILGTADDGLARTLTANMRARGEVALGNRIDEILNYKLPVAEYAAMRKLAVAPERAMNRGFKRYDQALTADGDVVVLGTAPKFGTVRVSNARTGDISVAEVKDLVFIPKISKTVTLKDGRTVLIKSVDLGAGTFTGMDQGKFGRGRQVGATPFAEIASLQHEAIGPMRARAALEAMKDGSDLVAARTEAGETLVPITPVEVMTPTGEAVIATAVSESTVEVTTKAGKKRTLKKDGVNSGTRASKPASPAAVVTPEAAAAADEAAIWVKASGEVVDGQGMSHPVSASQVLGYPSGEDAAALAAALKDGNIRAHISGEPARPDYVGHELSIELPWTEPLVEAQRESLRRTFAAVRARTKKPVEVTFDQGSGPKFIKTKAEFDRMLAEGEAGSKAQSGVATERVVPLEPAAAGEPRIVTVRDEIDDLTKQIRAATGLDKKVLQAQKARLQGEFKQLEARQQESAGDLMPEVSVAQWDEQQLAATLERDAAARDAALNVVRADEPVVRAPAASTLDPWAVEMAQNLEPVSAPAPEPATAPARRASKAVSRRQPQPPQPRAEIVDFTPGSIPDDGHRIYYMPVLKESVPAFEAAWAAGESIEPFTAMGTHVVPPYVHDPRYSLYAVEVAKTVVDGVKKPYTRAANRMLDALGGKPVQGTLEYVSPVNIGHKSVSQGRIYRIADELHAATQRSSDALAALEPAERTAYLRNLLTMNEQVDSQMAEAATQVRAGQAQTAAAVEAGDALAAAAGQEAEIAGLVEAAKQTQRVTAGDALAAIRDFSQPTDRARLTLAPEEVARRDFLAQGAATPEARQAWVGFIADLEPRPEGYVGESGQRLSLLHSQDIGQRLIITKVESAALEGVNRAELRLQGVPDHLLTEGQKLAKSEGDRPFADLVPTKKTRWQLTALDNENKVIREESGFADSPEAVAKYVDDNGYIPATTLIGRDFGYYADDGRIGVIFPDPKGGVIARVNRILETDPETGALTPEAAAVYMAGTPEDARAVVAQIGFRGVDDSNGWVTIVEDAKKFANRAEAEAWFKTRRKEYPLTRGSKRTQAEMGAGLPDTVDKFVALPPLSALRDNPIGIAETHDRVAGLLVAARRQRFVSPELQVYATELSQMYEAVPGNGPAFDRGMRDWLDIPTVEDIGPNSSRPTLDDADLMSGKLSVEDKTGVYDAEELAELLARGTQTIHISAESSNRALRAQGKLYGRLSASQMPGTENLELAQDIIIRRNEQTRWTAAHLDAQETVSTDPNTIDRTLGTLKETGEIVEIVDAPIDDVTLTIRSPETGRTTMVAKDLVEPGRTPGGTPELVKALDYMRYTRGAPEIGADAVEQNLGLAGVRDRNVVAQAFGRKADELVADLRLSESGDALLADTPPESITDLFALLRRGDELELTKVIVSEGARPELQPVDLRPLQNLERAREGLPSLPPSKPLAKGTRPPWEVREVEVPVVARGEHSAKRARTPKLSSEAKAAAAADALETINSLDPAADLVGAAAPAQWSTGEVLVPGAKLLRGSKSVWVAQRRVGVSVKDAVWDAIRKADPRLEAPLRRAYYSELKRQLGEHPYAELQAKAMSETLLPGQADILRVWAKDAGLSPNLPLGRVVVELAKQNHFNPRAAQIAVQMRKDAGFWNIGMSTQDVSGLGTLTLKVRRPNNYASHDLNFVHDPVPYKILGGHPLTRLMDDIIGYGQEKERALIMHGRLVWEDLQKHEYTKSDLLVLRKALGTHDTWETAATAGLDARYQYGFNVLRSWYDDRLEDVVRYFLRRNLEPIKYTGTETQQEFLRKRGIEPADWSDKGGFLSISSPDPWRKQSISGTNQRHMGEKRSPLTEDHISRIMEMRRDRRAGIQGPREANDIKFFESAGYTPQRLEEIVDYWSGYGVKNYWPLVHEGNLIVVDQAGKVYGFATNLVDAMDGVHNLVDQGVLTLKNGRITENIRIEQRTPIYDDILVGYTSKSDLLDVGREMARHSVVDAESIQGMVYIKREPGQPGYVRPPNLVHAKPRIAQLNPMVIDPAREFGIYTGRVARMQYRFNVMQAFRVLEDKNLDVALSAYHKTGQLHGKQGWTALRQYAYDHMSTALGEPGWVEEQLDQLMGFMRAKVTAGPVLRFKKELNERYGIGREVPVSNSDISNPKFWARAYSSRMAATNIVQFQSRWRLGGSIGSAVSNATQYWTTTAAKLQGHGLGWIEAERLAVRSWHDGIDIYRAHEFGVRKGIGLSRVAGVTLTPEQTRLARLVDESGMALMPTKYEAGTRGAFGESSARPLGLGRTPAQHALDLTSYYSMLLFSGAEKVNRFSTAIAALRLALDPKGMNLDEAAAKAFARNMVRETQFLYDELAIPHAILKLGPIGRVLFQFKPFLLNMMSFEKDLMVNAFTPGLNGGLNSGAINQLATHLGALAVFGGAVGLAANPVVELGAMGLKAATGIDLSPDRLSSAARASRRADSTSDERFRDVMTTRLEDVFYYGLPGLLGLSMGRRVGVSGQDLALGANGSTIWGPHLSMYINAAAVANQMRLQRGTGRAITGAAVGALLPGFMPGKSAQVVSSIPGVRLLTAQIGGWVGSGNLGPLPRADNSMADIMKSTKEGRRFTSQATPTLYRNFARSFAITADGAVRDLNGAPMFVPVEDRAAEASWMLLGLPSIRQQETSAAVSMMTASSPGDAATMRSMVDRIAEAYVKLNEGSGSRADVFTELMAAQRMGLFVNDASVKRRIEAITASRLETVRKRQPRMSR